VVPDLHNDWASVEVLDKPNISMVRAWLKPEFPRFGNSIKKIPDHLLSIYTMDNKIELYYPPGEWGGDAYYGSPVVWSVATVNDYRNRAKQRQHFTYPTGMIYDGFAAFSDKIDGKRGLVIGSASPWMEAILLEHGAAHVTTVEFLFLISEHPQISTWYAPLFTENFLKGKIEPFDFVVSYSSLEHDGLGRYGDVLNPIGDFESMARCLSYVKPGGFYFVGVPVLTKDYLSWPLHRIYGPARLPHFLAGWNLLAAFPRPMKTPAEAEYEQPLIVLQNPYGCSNGKSYKDLYPEPIAFVYNK